MTINKLELKDAGTYFCKAQNSEGNAQKKFHLSVVSPPEFFETPKNTTFIQNDKSLKTKTVKCLALGNPDPVTSWTFKNKKIKDGYNLELTSSMESGLYKCVVENSEAKKEFPFHLKVISQPMLLSEYEKTLDVVKTIQEGLPLELLCPFKNFDKISWKHQNISLKPITQKLDIKNIGKSNAGVYECTATNLAGSGKFLYEVDVLISPKIVVVDPTTFKKTLKDYSSVTKPLNEGEKLSLSCEAEGNPKPSVQWLKFGEKVSEEEILEIKSVTTSHSGKYVCEATNSVGSASITFNVIVSSPPYIIDDKEKVEVAKSFGESVSFECNVDGSEPVKIIWFKDE